jgi:hypothetical protein
MFSGRNLSNLALISLILATGVLLSCSKKTVSLFDSEGVVIDKYQIKSYKIDPLTKAAAFKTKGGRFFILEDGYEISDFDN